MGLILAASFVYSLAASQTNNSLVAVPMPEPEPSVTYSPQNPLILPGLVLLLVGILAVTFWAFQKYRRAKTAHKDES